MENTDYNWNKVNKRSLFSFLIIMNALMQLIAVVSLITIGVLMVLLAIYARIYSNTRASFTLGLIFFADYDHVAKYNCSLCLFHYGRIILFAFTSVFCSYTYYRTCGNSLIIKGDIINFDIKMVSSI